MSYFTLFKSVVLLHLWLSYLSSSADFKNVRTEPKRLNVHVIIPALYSPYILGTYHYLGPGFDSALEDIQKSFPKLHVTTKVISSLALNITDCKQWSDNVERLVAQSYHCVVATVQTLAKSAERSFVIVLMNGGCTEAALLGRLAREWNIIYINSVESLDRRQRPLYPTQITTTVNTLSTFVKISSRFTHKFHWNTIVIIVDLGSNPSFEMLGKVILADLSRDVSYQMHYLTTNSAVAPVDYLHIMRLLKQTTRVCLYLGHSDELRKLLIAASGVNMTNGDYVYVTMVPFRYPTLGNYTWKFDDQFDEVAREAFKSLFLVELGAMSSCNLTANRNCTDYDSIWKQRTADVYHRPYPADNPVVPHVASSYGAFMILAQVLNEVHERNADFNFSDGIALTKHYLNRTYNLPTGQIVVDDMGERVIPMDIRQFNKDLTDYETVFRQDPITLELIDVAKVRWPGWWPILDRPLCGLDGRPCQYHDTLASQLLYGIIPGVAVMSTLLIWISV